MRVRVIPLTFGLSRSSGGDIATHPSPTPTVPAEVRTSSTATPADGKLAQAQTHDKDGTTHEQGLERLDVGGVGGRNPDHQGSPLGIRQHVEFAAPLGPIARRALCTCCAAPCALCRPAGLDKIAKALKPVYTAPTESAVMERWLEFTETWDAKYPAIVRLWENAWAEFGPFPQFDPEIPKVVCSTNAIESVNARIRRAVKACGHFPNEQTVLKCIYLVVMSLDPTGTGRKRWIARWRAAPNAFDIAFEGRLTPPATDLSKIESHR